MESIILDGLVEAVIYAVRQDVIDSLMETECCKWSKRRIRKLCKKLHERRDAMESIEMAKEHVRKSLANLTPLSSPVGSGSETSSMSSECSDVIEETENPESIIIEFIRKITTI